MGLKVLIVDDERIKMGNIQEVLLETGKIDEAGIETVMTVEDAIKRIKSCRYDMVVLDVSLPYHISRETNRTGGVAVLKCITTMDQAKRPLCVLGLTGYEDSLQQSEEEFENAACVLIKYHSDSAEWRNKLKEKLKWLYYAKQDLEKELKESAEYLYDMAVITATAVEYKAVRCWNAGWKEERLAGDPEIYCVGKLAVNGTEKSVVLAKQKYMGMTAASALTSKIISQFRPRYVCMVGITGGRKDEVSIGDIIVADESWDYGSGKWKNEDGQVRFCPEPHYISLSPEMHALFTKDFSAKLREIRDQWNKAAETEVRQDARLHLGALASGAAVIQNEQIRKQYIDTHHRRVLGVDMETYGVYYACENAMQPAPQYFSVKAVSDYADESKDDRYQKYCAYLSAWFVFEVMVRGSL